LSITFDAQADIGQEAGAQPDEKMKSLSEFSKLINRLIRRETEK